MKKNTTLLFIFFSLFCCSIISAQSDNTLKIVGCWEVRQVIFAKDFEGSDEISMQAIGTIICFDKDGKFTHKKGETTTKGNYSLSENGRTLYQSSEPDPKAPSNHIQEDIPGQIVILSDTELQIQAEEMTLYFRREN